MDTVLLLNASNEPLNVCSWRRALILLMKGKAEKVEHINDLLNENSTTTIVIRLRYYVVVPGKELPFNRRNIFHRDEYTCQYCGKKTHNLTLDHVFPKSRGGKNSWDNIVAACPECNTRKADRTPQEANMILLKKPVRPTNYLKFELTKYSQEAFNQWEKYIAS